MLLEVYEYHLKDYPNQLRADDTQIKLTHLAPSQCGVVSTATDSRKFAKVKANKFSADKQLELQQYDTHHRSCDVLDFRTQTAHHHDQIPLQIDETLKSGLQMQMQGVSLLDLHAYTNLHGAKQRLTQPVIPAQVPPSMRALFDVAFVQKQLKAFRKIVSADWAPAVAYVQKQLKTFAKTHTLMKKVSDIGSDRLIVIGDLHGSFATFVRHLTRWRMLGILDQNAVLAQGYQLVFLGDLIDRGVYGYELLLLVYLLKITNPHRVHVNRGNHEDHNLSSNMGKDRSLESQMRAKLTPALADTLYADILQCFELQHSAIMFANAQGAFVYMAHGGYPVCEQDGLVVLQTKDYRGLPVQSLQQCVVYSDTDISINGSNSIRWADFQGKRDSTLPSATRCCELGADLVRRFQTTYNAILTIRGHQDSLANTALLITPHAYASAYAAYPFVQRTSMVNVNVLDTLNAPRSPRACKSYSHSVYVRSAQDSIQVNGNEYDTLLPVVTVSTNTDAGRDLDKDSYVVARFTDQPNATRECHADPQFEYIPALIYDNLYNSFNRLPANLPKLHSAQLRSTDAMLNTHIPRDVLETHLSKDPAVYKALRLLGLASNRKKLLARFPHQHAQAHLAALLQHRTRLLSQYNSTSGP